MSLFDLQLGLGLAKIGTVRLDWEGAVESEGSHGGLSYSAHYFSIFLQVASKVLCKLFLIMLSTIKLTVVKEDGSWVCYSLLRVRTVVEEVVELSAVFFEPFFLSISVRTYVAV